MYFEKSQKEIIKTPHLHRWKEEFIELLLKKQANEKLNEIFKALREIKHQSRILHPEEFAFNSEQVFPSDVTLKGGSLCMCTDRK